jgi:hypothetical protein
VLRERLEGRIYNAFGDGGYLIWRRVLPVYVDGRTEVHPREFWEEYFGVPQESWSERADRDGVNIAVVPRRGYEWLMGGLSKLPGWSLVHVDEREAVFVREIPEHADVVARYRVDPAALRE